MQLFASINRIADTVRERFGLGVQVHAGVQIGVQNRLFKTCFP